MATDFWSSSHFKRWITDKATVQRARQEDLKYVDDSEHVELLGIFFANLLSQLGTKLQLRQRVIATATVFFRRFYLKSAYCETDPYLVLAACIYVASKAEESPAHIKNVVAEARNIFGAYNIRNFPTDNSKLAEMEFYLVDDLECDLVVFHPYRTLMALVNEISASGPSDSPSEKEAGEVGTGIDDGRRFWGTGEGRLDMLTSGIQHAWFLINDTFRSDICLMYPPHLIAIAALYLTCIIHPLTRAAHAEWMEAQQAAASAAASAPQTRRSLRHSSSSSSSVLPISQKQPATALDSSAATTERRAKQPPQDFVGFFAGLNVNMRLVATITQEMLSFYALCDRFKEDFNLPPSGSGQHQTPPASSSQSVWTRSAHAQGMSRSGSIMTGASTTPGETGVDSVNSPQEPVGFDVDSKFLVQLLNKMRMSHEVDAAHPELEKTRPHVAVNKVLERTQAAG